MLSRARRDGDAVAETVDTKGDSEEEGAVQVSGDGPEEVGAEAPASEASSTPAEGLVGRAQPREPHTTDPVRSQLDRLGEQIRGLQTQLDDFIAHRSEAVSEQASTQVAAIVAAAEESAAAIRESAESDAAALRDRLLTDTQAEVERIRAEAQADAGRIRTEAHAEAARVREQTIVEASSEIQAVCARLAEELQIAARNAVAGISGGQRVTAMTPSAPPPPGPTSPEPVGDAPPAVADDIEEAVDELQTAAAGLEQSLRHLRGIEGDAPTA